MAPKIRKTGDAAELERKRNREYYNKNKSKRLAYNRRYRGSEMDTGLVASRLRKKWCPRDLMLYGSKEDRKLASMDDKTMVSVYLESRRIRKRRGNKIKAVSKRVIVLKHYGGERPMCECCGEDRFEFLAIDHIDGGGHRHRKGIRAEGSGMTDWIIKNNFPEGYRILCHNCNLATGFYGYCPHNATSIVKDAEIAIGRL